MIEGLLKVFWSLVLVVVFFCALCFGAGCFFTSCAVEQEDAKELEFYRNYIREKIKEERAKGTFPSKYEIERMDEDEQ